MRTAPPAEGTCASRTRTGCPSGPTHHSPLCRAPSRAPSRVTARCPFLGGNWAWGIPGAVAGEGRVSSRSGSTWASVGSQGVRPSRLTEHASQHPPRRQLRCAAPQLSPSAPPRTQASGSGSWTMHRPLALQAQKREQPGSQTRAWEKQLAVQPVRFQGPGQPVG